MVEDCEADLEEEEEEWNGSDHSSTFSDEGDTNKFESNDGNVRKCKLLNVHFLCTGYVTRKMKKHRIKLMLLLDHLNTGNIIATFYLPFIS